MCCWGKRVGLHTWSLLKKYKAYFGFKKSVEKLWIDVPKKQEKKNTQTGKILLKIFLLSLIPELFLSIYKLIGAVA